MHSERHIAALRIIRSTALVAAVGCTLPHKRVDNGLVPKRTVHQLVAVLDPKPRYAVIDNTLR